MVFDEFGGWAEVIRLKPRCSPKIIPQQLFHRLFWLHWSNSSENGASGLAWASHERTSLSSRTATIFLTGVDGNCSYLLLCDGMGSCSGLWGCEVELWRVKSDGWSHQASCSTYCFFARYVELSHYVRRTKYVRSFDGIRSRCVFYLPRSNWMHFNNVATW